MFTQRMGDLNMMQEFIGITIPKLGATMYRNDLYLVTSESLTVVLSDMVDKKMY
jgi:hypothetical protein